MGYANNKSDDPFLYALAKGDFQLEELARLQYPNGIFIDTANHEYDKAFQFIKGSITAEKCCAF